MGTTPDGRTIRLFDEDRGNIHILGSPRQGKSKLLEMLVCHDIQCGNGATLIDPSQNGETMNKVLRYACKQGYEKILLINPKDFFRHKKIPVLNPIHYKHRAAAIAPRIMDLLRVAWTQTSWADTPRIQKYLRAVITALHAAGMTLAECRYFVDRTKNHNRRAVILSHLSEWDHHRTFLEAAIKNQREWDGFLPTINRLTPLLDPTMELLVGSKKGINFQKIIKEKYLVLVNLDPTDVWDTDQQITLGTLLLAELQHAVHALREYAWQGKHYIYLDEAGLFATRKLADFLYYQPKTGLLFTFAHHSFDQFEDPYVLAAVRNATQIKAMFWAGNDKDRAIMLKDLGYGGELPDREVNYSLAQIESRYTAFRNNKQAPQIFRLKDVPDVHVDSKVLEAFKIKLYSQGFYRSPEEIRAEINNRFVHTQKTSQPVRRSNFASKAGSNTKTVKRGTGNDSPAVSASDTVLQRGEGDRADSHSSETTRRPGNDIPVSWNLPVDNSNVKPAPKRRKGKTPKGGVSEGGQG